MWAPTLVQPLRPFGLRQAADAFTLLRCGAKPSIPAVRPSARPYSRMPRGKDEAKDSIAIAASARHTGRQAQQNQTSPSSSMLVLMGALGLAGFATWNPRTIYCEPADDIRSYANKARENQSFNFDGTNRDEGRDPFSKEYPKSDVNVYNLGFGTVCGICAGVFIKKGARLVAFLLGGGFILLQYLNTQRIIKVDWKAMGRRYDNALQSAAGEERQGPLVYKQGKQATGWRDSTAARLWTRFTHFLTADFPSRGTFLAGLVLGLRLG